MRAESRFSRKPPVVREGGSFEVGSHVVRLQCEDGRWSASVDGVREPAWYTSQADAWQAGVREADRLDRGVAAAAG